MKIETIIAIFTPEAFLQAKLRQGVYDSKAELAGLPDSSTAPR